MKVGSIRAAIHGRGWRGGRAARKSVKIAIHEDSRAAQIPVNYLSEMFDQGLQWVKMDLRIWTVAWGSKLSRFVIDTVLNFSHGKYQINRSYYHFIAYVGR